MQDLSTWRASRSNPPSAVEKAFDDAKTISIRGAREHNLKNVDLTIPRDKLVVFTGLSGSGKSSLAFDTIYAEGQRRYVESLSAYARQFLEMMQKPDVDQIDGLSPAISIEQKTTSHNPRSTVGTVTEIYDYMRLLWARVGIPYSPATGLPIESQTVSQMVDRILALPRRHAALSAGAGRARPQGRIPQGNRRFHEARLPAPEDRRRISTRSPTAPALDKKLKHDIDVVVDRIVVRKDIARAPRRSLRDGARTRRRARHRRICRREARRRVDAGRRPKPRMRAIVFSSKFACPVSGFTIPGDRAAAVLVQQSVRRLPDLRRPRHASRRSIADLVVPDPKLTLRKGAIAPWAKSTSPYYLQTLEALGKHYKFRLDTPWEDLPKKVAGHHPLRLGRGGDPLRL